MINNNNYNNKPFKKKLFHLRVYEGLKKGFLTPTLPEHVLKFQSNPLVRIFRVLGGISVLCLLGKSYIHLNINFIYISMVFSIIFLIYHIIITYYRVKHIYILFKNKDLDVRNSPYDRMATIIAKAVLCAKGVCETAQPVGLTLGIMLGADEILKQSGRDAFFGPLLGNVVNTVLPETDAQKWKKGVDSGLNSIDTKQD